MFLCGIYVGDVGSGLKINEYVRKFGSVSRFVQKIIDSLDCSFAIVDVGTYEIEVTNESDFFPGMKCCDLFRCGNIECEGRRCPIAKVVEGKKSLVVKNNGGDDLLEIHIHPIFDSQGSVVSVIIYGFDVTQSQALGESERRFRSLFESSPRGMLMYQLMPGNKLVLINTNSAVDDILKIDSKKLIGKTVEQAFPALANNEIPDEFRKVAVGGKVWCNAETFYEYGGITGFYELVAFQTSPGVMVVSFTDITDKKRTENRLKEREAEYVKEVEDRFYNILQNSQDLVYRYDFKKDEFTYVSESVFTILGYSLGEFMKMKMSDYKKKIHPDDLNGLDSVGNGSEIESISNVEYRFKKKSGDYVWLRVQRVFFRDKEGDLIYSIEDIRDVTAEKLIEEENAKLEERLTVMRNKFLEVKERVSLTEKEQLVLWGFCRYPLLNDEELARNMKLKRSTLTAIKNRLKGKNWFKLNYIPNFHKMGCQFFSIFDLNVKNGRAENLDFLKKTSQVILSNYQDDKLLGVFVSDRYVDFKKFLDDFGGVDKFRNDFHKNSFFYDLDSIKLYDASGLVNSMFGLKRSEVATVCEFDNGAVELNTNEKRVLHAMVKYPEMSSSDIAKKIWTSKPTVIKIRKKLLDQGYVYPYVLPDFRKMGFSCVARLSFNFDSGLPIEVDKERVDPRIVLLVKGKKKMVKIMLFSNEDEYIEEIDLIKDFYRKKGFDFSLNSDVFLLQKRRSCNTNMESYVNDVLFGDEI